MPRYIVDTRHRIGQKLAPDSQLANGDGTYSERGRFRIIEAADFDEALRKSDATDRPRFRVETRHGELHTIYHVIDTHAPAGAQPAIISSWVDTPEGAAQYCQNRNDKERRATRP